MATKRKTRRRVSRTKRAAKRRAGSRPVYKVKGGWAVGRGRKRCKRGVRGRRR